MAAASRRGASAQTSQARRKLRELPPLCHRLPDPCDDRARSLRVLGLTHNSLVRQGHLHQVSPGKFVVLGGVIPNTPSRRPTINDDLSLGIGIGMLWLYSAQLYICLDATIGAAIWGLLGTTAVTSTGSAL